MITGDLSMQFSGYFEQVLLGEIYRPIMEAGNTQAFLSMERQGNMGRINQDCRISFTTVIVKPHIVIFVFCTILFLMGCNERRHGNNGDDDVRTDVVPIEKRLQHLPGIISAKWKVQLFGSSHRIIDVPGPASYRIWGYGKFKTSELAEVVSAFNDFSQDNALCVDFPYLDEKEHDHWRYSKSFTDLVKPALMGGFVWVCPEEGLIYFDLMGE